MINIRKLAALLISLALSTGSVGLAFAEANENQTEEQTIVEQTTEEKQEQPIIKESSSVTQPQLTSNNIKTMQVTTSSLNVRSGPDTKYSKLGSISRNTKVEAIEVSGKWYKIKYKNGYGWCSGDYLKEISSNQGIDQNQGSNSNNSSNESNTSTTPVIKTLQVTTSSLNVRSGPNTKYSKLGSISRNTKVEAVEKSGVWYKIKYKNGYGWCSGDYLKEISSNQGTDQNQGSNSNNSSNESNSSTTPTIKTLQVTTSSLNVRSGPNTKYSKLGSISRNTKVEAVEKSGVWYKIKYKNGYGWCSGDYLKEISSNQGTNQNQGSNSNNQSGSSTVISTLYVTTSSLNVRSGPNTTYSKLGSLSKNTKVEAVEKSGVWYKIKYKDGYGWCSGDYLSTKSTSDTQPPTNVGSGYQIVIDTKSNNLWYYKNGNLVKQFRVATGKSSTQTPKGTFKIVNKIKNRPYYTLNIPGGDPRNPLGDRWLGLQVGKTYGTTYGIHGTNNENSIGSNVSGGCIRMYNSDVRWLFEQVPIGTMVTIK